MHVDVLELFVDASRGYRNVGYGDFSLWLESPVKEYDPLEALLRGNVDEAVRWARQAMARNSFTAREERHASHALRTALAANRGDREATARQLGVSRRTVGVWARSLGVAAPVRCKVPAADKLAALARHGGSVRKAARELGLSPSSLSQWLHRRGEQRRKLEPKRTFEEYIHSFVRNQWDRCLVAAELGVSVRSVSKWLQGVIPSVRKAKVMESPACRKSKESERLAVLAKNRGDIRKSSQELGLSRSGLSEWLKRRGANKRTNGKRRTLAEYQESLTRHNWNRALVALELGVSVSSVDKWVRRMA